MNLIHVLFKLVYYTLKLDFFDKILEKNDENVKYIFFLFNVIFVEINKFIFFFSDENNNLIIEDENLLVLNNLSLYVLNDLFNKVYDYSEKLSGKFFEYFDGEKICFLKKYFDRILKINKNVEEILFFMINTNFSYFIFIIINRFKLFRRNFYRRIYF
jgi:hypothetical protein